MAIIASGSDASHFVTEDAVSELMTDHDILMEHCYVIREDKSRLTMINGEPTVINAVIHEWLNMCT